MRRLLSLLLSLCLLLSLTVGASAAEKGSFSRFRPVNTYSYDSFSDVSGWYAEYVSDVYTLGLMQGSISEYGERVFKPDGLITLAETVTLAARIHSIYYSRTLSQSGSGAWYQPYVDYALENGILTAGEFTNYNQSATRAQFASILARALGDEGYAEINTVEIGAIPDVDMDQKYSFSVYNLYRAGILTGGSRGAFRPDDSIVRSEAAAVAARMVMPSMRRSFDLYAPLYVGFTLDSENRGSVEITSLTMTTEDDVCYLTIDFKSQQSRFLSVMNASESLYILKVVEIEPGTEHFTFAIPLSTLRQICNTSKDPDNEKLTMAFYANGDPSSVTDCFYIPISQFAKYLEAGADE